MGGCEGEKGEVYAEISGAVLRYRKPDFHCGGVNVCTPITHVRHKCKLCKEVGTIAHTLT